MSGDALLLSNLSATLFLTGLVWFLQIVHLPLMLRASKLDFANFARIQRFRNTFLMAGPMLVEAVTGMWLWYDTPEGFSGGNLFRGAVLIVILWIVTLVGIVPLHSHLIDGYDESAIRSLMRRNWVRTVCWTLRAAMMIWVAASRLHLQ